MPEGTRRQPRDVEDVREDDAHAHEVTGEEAEEGAAGADGGDDLHSLAVLLAVDVREGEDELFVHLVREEDAVEDERGVQGRWGGPLRRRWYL